MRGSNAPRLGRSFEFTPVCSVALGKHLEVGNEWRQWAVMIYPGEGKKGQPKATRSAAKT
jgi:hypothetical protein